jgi:maleate cis-trans isomerase
MLLFRAVENNRLEATMDDGLKEEDLVVVANKSEVKAATLVEDRRCQIISSSCHSSSFDSLAGSNYELHVEAMVYFIDFVPGVVEHRR